jgi:hypothetical protein
MAFLRESASPPVNPGDFTVPATPVAGEPSGRWTLAIYVDGVDATMAAQLEAQANPTVVIKPAPWNPANAQPLSNPVQ